MSRRDCRLSRLLLGVIALLAVPGWAESGLLSGSLGQWLDATAAPQLAETLGRHPKFRGETVRFVSLSNGKPMATGNLLTQAVEQRLTQQLLRSEGVRLAWPEDPQTCAAPQDVPYLLGIEIHADGTRNHKLNIAMVDVAEGVWVSGVSLGWRGRLSSAERRALGRKVASGRAGSTENPLPVAEGTQISELMRAGLQCSLPGGLDGPLFIETPPQSDLAAISQSLTRTLSLTPLAAITPDRESAEWVMRLSARSVGGGAQQVVVTLQDTTSSEVVQQVASVFVTGLELAAPAIPPDPGVPPAVNPPAITPPPAGDTPMPELLTQLTTHHAEPNGICAHSRTRPGTCVEVGFRLLRPAYLLVLSTQDRQLRSQTWGRSLELARPGERRYRMRIRERTGSPNEPTSQWAMLPDAGLYVLAVEDRGLAQRLVRHLNRAPGACASVRSSPSLSQWLRELDELIARNAAQVAWRATHLRRSADGVVQL
jgi:hypothetical protein